MEHSNRYGWVSDDPVADEQMDIMYPEGADEADNITVKDILYPKKLTFDELIKKYHAATIINPDENAYLNSLEKADLTE